jgi:hypothetical protein
VAFPTETFTDDTTNGVSPPASSKWDAARVTTLQSRWSDWINPYYVALGNVSGNVSLDPAGRPAAYFTLTLSATTTLSIVTANWDDEIRVQQPATGGITLNLPKYMRPRDVPLFVPTTTANALDHFGFQKWGSATHGFFIGKDLI